MPQKKEIRLDELDFKILEALIVNSRIKFKRLAKVVHSDDRKIPRRVERLIKAGIIRNFTVEIDWSKLGFHIEAYVCTRTAIDEAVRKKLFDFCKNEPRIIRVNSTIGAYEYIIQTISKDLLDFREHVGTSLEPLTAGLSTSIKSENIKLTDYKSLLKIAEKPE